MIEVDFTELITARRSVRSFTDQTIEPEKLQAVLSAAAAAPSAGNLQAYEIYVVKQPRVRAGLARAADQSFIAEASVILVFFANPGRAARRYGVRGRDLYALQDATIAAAYAGLAAVENGLATVWIGAFDDRAVGQAIGAPGDWQPVAMLPIGYAAETPSSTPRRELTDLVHRA